MRRVWIDIQERDEVDVVVDVHVQTLDVDGTDSVVRHRHVLANRDIAGLRSPNDLLREVIDGISPLA